LRNGFAFVDGAFIIEVVVNFVTIDVVVFVVIGTCDVVVFVVIVDSVTIVIVGVIDIFENASISAKVQFNRKTELPMPFCRNMISLPGTTWQFLASI